MTVVPPPLSGGQVPHVLNTQLLPEIMLRVNTQCCRVTLDNSDSIPPAADHPHLKSSLFIAPHDTKQSGDFGGSG